jgi:hypothetical protein
MNLTKLGPSVWIIFLNIVLLIILLYTLSYKRYDSFINYPQQVNPSAKPTTNSGRDTANNNYASILMYVQQNPAQSVKFIQDVKQKFFDDSCKVKTNIDFSDIAQLPDGMPF